MRNNECEGQVQFWIISRDENTLSKNSERVLGLLGTTQVLHASLKGGPMTGQVILDCLLQGVPNGSLALKNEGCLWIIDEALATDWISMASLIEATGSTDADLAVYSRNSEEHSGSSESSFGIIRIGGRLAQKIVDSSQARQSLVAYGLFPALSATGDKSSVLEWSTHDVCRRFFHPAFPNCTESEVAPGIHYPVFEPTFHAAISSLNLDLAERLGSRVEPYVGCKARGWFVEDAARWEKWFAKKEATKVLEISVTDGISCNAMLDLLFPHPESEAHCIHTGETSQANEDLLEHLTSNAKTKGRVQQLRFYTGQPIEVLGWMIAGEGYWESFGFIHLRPTNNHIETMTVVGQAWSLLKPGGVILLDSGTMRFGESHPTKVVLETCARIIGNQADPLLTGELIALKKRRALMVDLVAEAVNE